MEKATQNTMAKLARDIAKHLKAPPGKKIKSEWEQTMITALDILHRAVHFSAKVKDLSEASTFLHGRVLRLPYEYMTLEFSDSKLGLLLRDISPDMLVTFARDAKDNEEKVNALQLLASHKNGFVGVYFVAFNEEHPKILNMFARVDKNSFIDGNWGASYDTIEDEGISADTFRQNTYAYAQWLYKLLDVLGALCTTHTEEVIQQASPKNNRRILDGKLPIWEVKTLVLKTPVTRTVSEYQGGTHASPRQHIRRGHYRHYKSGKIAWVRDCIVGSLEKGFVHKDYRVEPAAA